MLQTLRIKNLAIVENVQVEFQPGLNVVTGETGAGKSILIGALNLVLGGRADKSLIRSGETQCGIEAVFSLPDTTALDALLADLGIDPCEEGQLIIRRLVSDSGSGKNLVNGCAATVHMLKRMGDLLVDMHGPHDHQSLLDREFQLEMVDAFAELEKPRDAYREIYRTILDLEQERRALDGDDQQIDQQIDLLSYQVQEIEDAALGEADEEELEKEHTRVANAQRIIELASGAHSALFDDEYSAFNATAQAHPPLAALCAIMEEAAAWREEAESISIQLRELAATISDTVQSIDADPERLQWLDDRKALIHGLKRKYGSSVPQIIAFGERASTRLAELAGREAALASLQARIAEADSQLQVTGKKLRAGRKKAADKMAEAVTRELRDLGFEHGIFSIALEPREPGPSGIDAVEFGFAPNLGEAMRPLRAIASSGEISRVMLAIKTVLADHDRIPILVFDEIDANVGGETANAVGDKLAGVAGSHQVLCITHLPQVAVHGTTHFVVSKGVQDGRTRTMITGLSNEERAAEVGRMLGGKDLTSVTMEHAREMLANPRGKR